MPASVEILTKTQEFVRTKVSILVTLILSLGPTWAAVVGWTVNRASRLYSAPAPRTLPTQERRSMFADMSRLSFCHGAHARAASQTRQANRCQWRADFTAITVKRNGGVG